MGEEEGVCTWLRGGEGGVVGGERGEGEGGEVGGGEGGQGEGRWGRE